MSSFVTLLLWNLSCLSSPVLVFSVQAPDLGPHLTKAHQQAINRVDTFHSEVVVFSPGRASEHPQSFEKINMPQPYSHMILIQRM